MGVPWVTCPSLWQRRLTTDLFTCWRPVTLYCVVCSDVGCSGSLLSVTLCGHVSSVSAWIFVQQNGTTQHTTIGTIHGTDAGKLRQFLLRPVLFVRRAVSIILMLFLRLMTHWGAWLERSRRPPEGGTGEEKEGIGTEWRERERENMSTGRPKWMVGLYTSSSSWICRCAVRMDTLFCQKQATE